jgi:hypothetical protein
MSMYRVHNKGYLSKFSSIQQLQELIGIYPRINSFLNFRYDETIKKQIAVRYYELASEYEKAGNYNSAGVYLEKSIAERSKITEVYFPVTGDTGDRAWNFLKRKLWFCKLPIFFCLVRLAAQGTKPFKMILKIFRLISG